MIASQQERDRVLQKMFKSQAELIRGFVKSLEKLENGKMLPKTDAQRHFLEVCRKSCPPETDYEFAYMEYKGWLRKIRSERSSRKTRVVSSPSDPWKLSGVTQPPPDNTNSPTPKRPSGTNDWGIADYEEGSPRPGFTPLDKYQ
jgi:uncharacterized protein YifE (UPF0438 family)